MNKDLKNFLEEIQKNTGITVALLGENTNMQVPESVNQVHFDLSNGATTFYVNVAGVDYPVYIKGAGETQRAFALLIRQLAGKGETKYSNAISFVHGIMMGEVDTNKIPALCKKFSVANRPLFALAILVDGNRKQEITDFLKNYNYGGKDLAIPTNEDVVILVKYVDLAVKEYSSINDYADTLCRSIYEETGIRIKIGVGGKVAGISALGESFSQAISAVKMMAKINAPKNVHSYREFALEKVLEEMPENRRMDYFRVLTDDGIKQFFKDEELLRTAGAFLDNDLNASETSRVLFIHRNTLNYRLDKIQNLTGFDLRKFADAVTFKMVSVLYELLG